MPVAIIWALATDPDIGKRSTMPRTARAAKGGYIYHALNRGSGRSKKVFHKPDDYAAFVNLIVEANERISM